METSRLTGTTRRRMGLRAALLLGAAFLFPGPVVRAETPLEKAVAEIAKSANANVAIACALPGTALNCDFNPAARPPMQSVFKLPLAMLVLHLVETGRFSLDQPIRFLASDRILPPPYSPLQTAHPEGEVDVPLRELIRLTAAESDNTAADILLRLAGGPPAVEAYLHALGIEEVRIVDTERGLHADPHAQFENWITPRAAVQMLQLLVGRSPLSATNTAVLLEILESSPSSRKRIGAGVPREAVVRHKSGTSDTVLGLTFAVNDIALVTLPGGRNLALAVFVTNSTDKPEVSEALISRIARTVYESAVKPEGAQ